MALLPLAIMLVAGCGPPEMDYGAIDLIEAHGTVTLDGQPLPAAVVTFEAPDGQFSYGMTDAEGHYELQFDTNQEGVTTGSKIVRISTTRKILGLNTEDEAAAEELPEEGGEGPAIAPHDQERVPPRYNQNSELAVEVTADRDEYNFDLQSS